MYSQMFAGPVTETQATQSYKPGELVVTNDKTYGTRTWRYIKNTDTIAISAGTIVQRKAATSDNMSGIVCVTAKKQRGMLLGVAQNSIAAGYFGFILKDGQGTVLAPAAATITAGSAVISNGEADGGGKNGTLTNADEVAAYIGDCLVTSTANHALTACNFFFP